MQPLLGRLGLWGCSCEDEMAFDVSNAGVDDESEAEAEVASDVIDCSDKS